MRGSMAGWTPIVGVIAALGATVLLAVGSASAQTVQSKREQAQAILAEMEQLDMEVGRAAEAYNYANLELGRLDGELEANARHLVAARQSLGVARRRIAQRLRDLYIYG